MIEIDPNWKPVAFKEWQVVCDAIASGEQTVILRKGGISEGKLGFQWLHDHFLLFPTQYHEQDKQVRPDGAGNSRSFEQGREDQPIRFQLYLEIRESGRLTDWEEICQLEDSHIWTRECIRERYEWGDEPGISYATFRAYALPEPWCLENRKGFGGCRSWIGLPADENGGIFEKLNGAEPVIPKNQPPCFEKPC